MQTTAAMTNTFATAAMTNTFAIALNVVESTPCRQYAAMAKQMA